MTRCIALANPNDVIVRYLALDRRRVVGVSLEWRRRTGIAHRVLGFGEQLVDVLKGRAHMPLMIFAKGVCLCLFTHFFASPLSPTSSTLNTRIRLR